MWRKFLVLLILASTLQLKLSVFSIAAEDYLEIRVEIRTSTDNLAANFHGLIYARNIAILGKTNQCLALFVFLAKVRMQQPNATFDQPNYALQ